MSKNLKKYFAIFIILISGLSYLNAQKASETQDDEIVAAPTERSATLWYIARVKSGKTVNESKVFGPYENLDKALATWIYNEIEEDSKYCIAKNLTYVTTKPSVYFRKQYNKIYEQFVQDEMLGVKNFEVDTENVITKKAAKKKPVAEPESKTESESDSEKKADTKKKKSKKDAIPLEPVISSKDSSKESDTEFQSDSKNEKIDNDNTSDKVEQKSDENTDVKSEEKSENTTESKETKEDNKIADVEAAEKTEEKDVNATEVKKIEETQVTENLEKKTETTEFKQEPEKVTEILPEKKVEEVKEVKKEPEEKPYSFDFDQNANKVSRYRKEYLQDYMPSDNVVPTDEIPVEHELIENPDEQDASGRTQLMIAAKSGNDWQIQNLLDSNANVNIQDKDGWTALMYAVRYQESTSIIKKLLEAKAGVKTINNFDSSALVLAACYNNNPEILKLILKSYSISEKEVIKAFVMMLSTKQISEYTEIAKMNVFLERSIPLNSLYNGKTPLMYSAQYGSSTKVLKLLLDNSALPGIRSSEGKTAFDYAEKNKNLVHDDIYWSLNKK